MQYIVQYKYMSEQECGKPVILCMHITTSRLATRPTQSTDQETRQFARHISRKTLKMQETNYRVSYFLRLYPD